MASLAPTNRGTRQAPPRRWLVFARIQGLRSLARGIAPWTHRPQSIGSGARRLPETDRHCGGQIVDDSRCLRFFLEPADTFHRRYEALRASFIERRPLKDIAQQFGDSYNTLRDVICDFRTQCRDDRVPPFSRPHDRGVRDATIRPRPSDRKPRRWRIVESWTSPRDAA
jgi:hypothetical protein